MLAQWLGPSTDPPDELPAGDPGNVPPGAVQPDENTTSTARSTGMMTDGERNSVIMVPFHSPARKKFLSSLCGIPGVSLPSHFRRRSRIPDFIADMGTWKLPERTVMGMGSP